MELRDYFSIIRRRWLIVVAAIVVCVGASGLLTAVATPMYASTASLFVSSAQSTTNSEFFQGGQFSAQRVTTYAVLAKSRDLAVRIIDETGVNMTPAELIENVTASVVPETVTLELTVLDADPKQAQTLAQAYAEGMTNLVLELEKPVGQTTPPVKMMIVDAASEPEDAVSPEPTRNLALGLIVGLLLGVGIAVLRDILDTTIKRPEDVGAVLDLPPLGGINYDSAARSAPLVTSLDPHAPRVEAFRVLRTNMQFIDVDTADKVFVVTSSLPGEGKTSTSINLAITLAQAGQRTLLIEGDLRRPKASTALGLDNAIGVTTVLVGKVGVEDAIQKHPDSDLHVLGSGAVPPNPAELLQSNAMAELLTNVREQYDVVIIDAPPLLPVTDAALLARQADGALLIVRHGKTTKDQLIQAVERLANVDAHALGYVLNMVPGRGQGYGYGYGYAPTT